MNADPKRHFCRIATDPATGRGIWTAICGVREPVNGTRETNGVTCRRCLKALAQFPSERAAAVSP